jgi:hypothetical protein
MTRTPVPLLTAALLAAVLATTPRPAAAAWPHDPTVNVPLCTATGNQHSPTIVADGAGGTIVTWQDYRGGATADIYVQKISATGTVLWTADGAALCTATGNQQAPTLVPDGAGGAIVTWYDYRGGAAADIYAQRISAAGAVEWTANGVALCTAAGEQAYPKIVPDGAGGAIVTWHDFRGSGADIYAQRISAAGAVLWTANGVALCTATGEQSYPTIASDGAGGAVVTWYDYRSSTNYDIYVQRISAAGAVLWTANGTALCTATGNQQSPTISSDGVGAAIVTWFDYRGGMAADIYAQRISAAGTVGWTANGVALCTAAGEQAYPKIVPDGAGGAIVAWMDERSGTYDVYAQRISTAGAVLWTANGAALRTVTAAAHTPSIVSDGAGGAIVIWSDFRNGTGDSYAQRISSSGVGQWTANGVALCTAFGSHGSAVIASDNAGGAVAAWYDVRSGAYDIYAQRVDRWGYLGAEPAIVSARDVPNDQGGQVKVSWNASPLDIDILFENIDSYRVYRSVPPSLAAQALASGRAVDEGGSVDLADGRSHLLVTTYAAQTYYWEYIGSLTGDHLTGYSYVVPTTGDSIAGSNPRTAFMVQARTVGGAQWWNSPPDSGYSVDNLAPPAPAPFTGQYTGGTATLHWAANAAPDLGEYRLYRGSSADFVPGPGNLIAAQPDTGYVDAAGAAFYYKLCAVDVHGNVSGFSTLLPSGTVDVAGPALPRAVFLAPPAPNPARGATTLRFGLPREARVELALYDQQGRRVRSLLGGTQPAGEQLITWNGHDDSGRALPAGLYFVRLATEGRTFVSRLAVIR